MASGDLHNAGNDQVVIGFNPGSGGGDRSSQVELLAQRLRQSGMTVTVCTTIEQAVAVTAEFFAAGRLRAYVCGGGDGTVRTMAEALPVGVPMVIFPLGTENLLARHFGIDARIDRAEQSVLSGTSHWIDAGMANGRLFLVMASCGFDAEVVNRVHGQRSGHVQRWSYFTATWRSLRSYPFFPLQVTLGCGRKMRECRWAFVFNVPRYAMHLRIAPEADPQDGLMDVCTFRRGRLWPGLAYIGAILLGQHRRWTNSQSCQAATIRIESEGRVPFQLDGDPGGELPLEVSVLPRRVCLRI